MAEIGGDVIGLDWRVRLDEGWERVGHDRGVQGNLDPALLLGPFERRGAGGPRRPRPRRRPAGAHLQPRPRRAAGNRSRRPAAARRARARANRESPREARGRPHGLREPVRLEDIRPYLEDIRGGRPVSAEAVEELTERYRRIGGRSPLDDVTEATRAALERELALPVFAGMKHWARASRRRPIRRSPAAPISSSASCSRRTIPSSRSTATASGWRGARGRAQLRFIESWHDSRAVPRRPRGPRPRHGRARRLHRAQPSRAHSRPRATRIRISCSRPRGWSPSGPASSDWSFAFQSGAPTGEPWLGPDILDQLDALRGVASTRARVPDRVRVRPSRDPLGPRRRGAGSAPPSSGWSSSGSNP